MTRPIPQLARGYGIAGKSRVFANRASAYYQIAKAMVVAKYPPGLDRLTVDYDMDGHEHFVDEGSTPRGWTNELAGLRRAKAEKLFHANGGGFDVDRWTKVVRRLARYLAFVDRHVTGRQRWSHLSDAQLTAKFEAAESEAGRWMTEANAMRLELRRREGEAT